MSAVRNSKYFRSSCERLSRDLMLNQIHSENCVETVARMPEGFIDLTVTSPPYDDLRVYKGFEFDVEAVADGLFRTTKDGGVVVWVVNDKTVNGDESGTSFRHALTFKAAGFKLWDTMIFAKNNPFPGDCGLRYRGVFEFMFAFVKGKEPKVFNPLSTFSKNPGKVFEQARLERDGRRYIRGSEPIIAAETRKAANIFYYSVGVNGDGLAGFQHPAVFPLQLAKDQITSWSNEGDTIYDPFMGSGTTAIAAVLLGRNYIGSEISEEYTELARERIRRETELPLFDVRVPDTTASLHTGERQP